MDKMKPYLIEAIRENNTIPLGKFKRMLWKDDCDEAFILCRGAAIYLQTGYKPETIRNATLRVHAWSFKLKTALEAAGLVLREQESSEEFYVLFTPISALPFILENTPKMRNRPDLRGNFITGLERRLGHDIRPYNPDLPEDEDTPKREQPAHLKRTA